MHTLAVCSVVWAMDLQYESSSMESKRAVNGTAPQLSNIGRAAGHRSSILVTGVASGSFAVVVPAILGQHMCRAWSVSLPVPLCVSAPPLFASTCMSRLAP